MVCYLSGAKPYLNEWLQIVQWILGNKFNKYTNQNTKNV